MFIPPINMFYHLFCESESKNIIHKKLFTLEQRGYDWWKKNNNHFSIFLTVKANTIFYSSLTLQFYDILQQNVLLFIVTQIDHGRNKM